MMPDFDGFALLRAIRADPVTVTVPFLLLSARAGEEARVEGLDAGADDYLVKPFTARELLARIGANIALARMRREVAEREQDLRRQIEEILDRVTDAFYAVDRELRLIYANRRLEELVRRPRAELVGRPIEEVFPDELDGENHRRRFAAIGGALSGRFESFSQALGEWIEGSIYRSDTGYSVYLRDVTSRKRVEEELRGAKAQAEAAALARCEFLAAAAHSLRQPLDLAINDMLRVTPGDIDDRQALTRAQRAAGRLRSALDKLAELAQLDSGQREPQCRIFALREVLEQISATWSPLAQTRQIVLELPEPRDLVHSDPEMLSEVLHHLVGNAIGNTERGRVWIECRRRDRVLVIEVHDTGRAYPTPNSATFSRSSISFSRRAARAWVSVCRSSGGSSICWGIRSRSARCWARDRAFRLRFRSGTGGLWRPPGTTPQKNEFCVLSPVELYSLNLTLRTEFRFGSSC